MTWMASARTLVSLIWVVLPLLTASACTATPRQSPSSPVSSDVQEESAAYVVRVAGNYDRSIPILGPSQPFVVPKDFEVKQGMLETDGRAILRFTFGGEPDPRARLHVAIEFRDKSENILASESRYVDDERAREPSPPPIAGATFVGGFMNIESFRIPKAVVDGVDAVVVTFTAMK